MSGSTRIIEGGVSVLGGPSRLREVRLAYMNVGRGIVATHGYLEWCARGEVGVAFVGECWVEREGGRGTQSHPDYVRVGSVSKVQRVACFIRRTLVDVYRVVECAHRFVCVEVGGVRLGGCMGVVVSASMTWRGGWRVYERWWGGDVGSYSETGMRTTVHGLWMGGVVLVVVCCRVGWRRGARVW